MSIAPQLPRSFTTVSRSLADLQADLHEAYAAGSEQSLYRALTLFAEVCIERGLTQTAADVLAFLLLQSEMDSETFAVVDKMIADLEGRICPRVIYDAREFAADMDLNSMIEYLMDLA